MKFYKKHELMSVPALLSRHWNQPHYSTLTFLLHLLIPEQPYFSFVLFCITRMLVTEAVLIVLCDEFRLIKKRILFIVNYFTRAQILCFEIYKLETSFVFILHQLKYFWENLVLAEIVKSEFNSNSEYVPRIVTNGTDFI